MTEGGNQRLNLGKHKDRNRRITKICEICGNSFEARVYRIKEPRRVQRVCSYQCQHKLQSLWMTANFRKGKVIRGNGYLGIYLPSHPRATQGYVLEHILVWEKAHNQPIPKGWIIHHKNHDKKDNRPENLEAMPRSKHNSNRLFQELQRRVEQQGQVTRLLRQEIRLNKWQIKELSKQLNEIQQLRIGIK